MAYVRFSAGAVNPDPNERGWSPGYNLVSLHVAGSGRGRKLTVEAHLRQWQSNPDMFRPMLNQKGEPVFRHEIEFPGLERHTAPSATADALAAVAPGLREEPTENSETKRTRDSDVEAAMGDASTRNLVFRFWNLTMSQRRDIALGLDLITREELVLPEPERYGRALIRAGERGRLDELARQVAQKEVH